jgi:hypothetical protein
MMHAADCERRQPNAAAARVSMEEDEPAPSFLEKQIKSLYQIRQQRLLRFETDLLRAKQQLRAESMSYQTARNRYAGQHFFNWVRLEYIGRLMRKRLLQIGELQAWRTWEDQLRDIVLRARRYCEQAAQRWVVAREAWEACQRNHRLAYLGFEKLKLLEQEMALTSMV